MGSETLEIIVDNVVARENVLKFARSQGHSATFTEDNGECRIAVTKGDAAADVQRKSMAAPTKTGNSTLYLVGSDEFGRGSAELGRALMKTFFYALSESGADNNYLIFVNAGVKLVCEGSALLESVRKLAGAGWDVKACGTCLDFYDLKEQLLLGEITNMYTIVELMEQAGKVVTL